jgi:hypothetical protein
MTATPTSPPTEGCIDTQVLDHVLLIGINRPAKRNGWTPPMFKQLAEAYTRLDDDPSCAWACCMPSATTSRPASTCPRWPST